MRPKKNLTDQEQQKIIESINEFDKHNMETPKQHVKKCRENSPWFGTVNSSEEKNCNCDGYHTFEELYDHRIMLFIVLCKAIQRPEYYGDVRNVPGHDSKVVWRSKYHHDGTTYDGWYIMGIGREKGKQISYHLPLSHWEETSFAETLERAPEWDGHTSDDVLERLKKL